MRGSRWSCILCVVGLALGSGAQAAPRISLGTIRSDRKAQLGKQLASALCSTYECVSATRVFTAKKPDFKKAKAQKVKGIVLGTVTHGAKKTTASLALLTGPGRPAQTWNFPLTQKGTLAPSALRQLTQDLDGTLGGAPVAPTAPALPATPPPAGAAPSPTPLPTVPAEPAPLPTAPPLAGSSASPLPGDKSLADTPVAADASSGASTELTRPQPFVVVEAGLEILNRHFSYGGNPGTLRSYSASVIALPRADLALFPFAKTDSFLSGLGIEGHYAFSVGLKSTLNGDERSTNITHWEAGLEWRIRPIRYSDFAIIPVVAYRNFKFQVNDGGPFDGLPNLIEWGIKGGLNVEIPLTPAGSRDVIILAGADYVYWKKKENLIGTNAPPNFFSDGSAYAIEAELGIAVGLFGPLQIRALGEFSQTHYSLSGTPASVDFTSTEATDRYLGGRFMLHLQF